MVTTAQREATQTPVQPTLIDALKNRGQVLVWTPTENFRLTVPGRGVNMITAAGCEAKESPVVGTKFLLMVTGGIKPAVETEVRQYAEEHELILKKFDTLADLNHTLTRMWGRADKGQYACQLVEKPPKPKEESKPRSTAAPQQTRPGNPTAEATAPPPTPQPADNNGTAPQPDTAVISKLTAVSAAGLVKNSLASGTKKREVKAAYEAATSFRRSVERLRHEMNRLGIISPSYSTFLDDVTAFEASKRRLTEPD